MYSYYTTRAMSTSSTVIESTIVAIGSDPAFIAAVTRAMSTSNTGSKSTEHVLLLPL